VLEILERMARDIKITYKVWKDGYDRARRVTPASCGQKMEYVHNNPANRTGG